MRASPAVSSPARARRPRARWRRRRESKRRLLQVVSLVHLHQVEVAQHPRITVDASTTIRGYKNRSDIDQTSGVGRHRVEPFRARAAVEVDSAEYRRNLAEGADEERATIGRETHRHVVAVQRGDGHRRAAADREEVVLAIGGAAEDEAVVGWDLRAADVLRRAGARRSAVARLHPQPRWASPLVALKQGA